MKKDFEEVWIDIQRVLQNKDKITTICKGVSNQVIRITPEQIVLKSELSKKGIYRKLCKKDFEYVWDKLSKGSIYGLNDVRDIIGRRAIICAILALLDYVEGECINGRVHLRLKT